MPRLGDNLRFASDNYTAGSPRPNDTRGAPGEKLRCVVMNDTGHAPLERRWAVTFRDGGAVPLKHCFAVILDDA
eukprot:scaffold81389_cov30-Tisochrysis_lutea.AAC.3